MTSRRDFLKVVAVGSAWLVAPWPLRVYRQPPRQAVAAPLPRLWGDGVHDDAAAIQARLDRGGYALPAGTYLVTAPLVLRSARCVLRDSWFRVRHEGPRLMMQQGARETVVMGCNFQAV
jgi:hypothetical protein